MSIQMGKKYYRHTNCGVVNVREIIDIRGNYVYYKRIFGPDKSNHIGRSLIKNFLKTWILLPDDVEPVELCGVKKQRTINCRSIHGNMLFRCSERTANRFLRKGFAVQCEDGIQLTNDTMDKKFASLLTDLNPFFFATKNDKCVVCGDKNYLTQHHVVPRRHKHRVPEGIRRFLSNILFLCYNCHSKYEDIQEPTQLDDPNIWMNHFIESMNPQYLPDGWTIIVPNQKPLEENNESISNQ